MYNRSLSFGKFYMQIVKTAVGRFFGIRRVAKEHI